MVKLSQRISASWLSRYCFNCFWTACPDDNKTKLTHTGTAMDSPLSLSCSTFPNCPPSSKPHQFRTLVLVSLEHTKPIDSMDALGRIRGGLPVGLGHKCRAKLERQQEPIESSTQGLQSISSVPCLLLRPALPPFCTHEASNFFELVKDSKFERFWTMVRTGPYSLSLSFSLFVSAHLSLPL